MGKTYVQSGLHYGAYYGLAVFAFNLLLYFTLGNPLGPVSLLGLWIPVLFICAAIKNHRDKQSGGYISYGGAFKTGIATIIFGAALYSILMYMFGMTLGAGMLEDYKSQMLLQGEQLRQFPFFSQSLIEKMIESIDKITMTSVAANEYFSKVIGGVFFSLIAAAIFMKTKTPV